MPKHKLHDDFWDEFESECAASGLISKIPLCIKTILTSCGYNSSWSLKTVTEESLAGIEKYIEERHRALADSFEEYKQIEPFEFLPGHRVLILGIISEIIKIEENKKSKITKYSKPRPVLSEQDLQTLLINQVSKFSDGIKLQCDWTDTIKDFVMTITENKNEAECKLECPICNSFRIVRFDKHWTISNMCKHLRSHITDVSKITNKEQKKVAPTGTKSIRKSKNINMDVVHHYTNSSSPNSTYDVEVIGFVENQGQSLIGH